MVTRVASLVLVLLALPGCPSDPACAFNSDCPRGSHCAAGECATDCTPATVDDDCAPGQACNSFGMCVGETADAGLDAPPPLDGGIDAPMGLDAPPTEDAGTDAPPLDAGTDAPTLDTGTDAPALDAGTDAPVALTGALVINEVDYDQPGTDAAEFVELYNGGSTNADLTGLAVVLVNGSTNAEYARATLSGTLAPGAFLVVGVAGQTLTLPGGVTRVDLGVAIQNGAPDGVVLWDTVRHVALDALSYEGSLTAATIDGTPVSLVEGTPTPLVESNSTPDSLCRRPDGHDTNDAATDWMLCTTPTPGGSNG